jgi:integrase
VARTASPWFWEERQGWYVNKDGQRHFLGEHPQSAPPPRKIKKKWNVPEPIPQAFHALMAAPTGQPDPTPTANQGPTVAAILDKYLTWCQQHSTEGTYGWYRDYLQNFLDSLPDPLLAVADLRPFHVVEWVDSHADWSPAYRRGAIVAVQRPFNWAEELGHITVNPIKKIKKPQPQRRENPITPDDFNAIIVRYKDNDPFRDLLEFAWHSGCRPQEARHIEPRHVHLDAECITIPKDEAKGRRRARVILLDGRALEIVKRLLTVCSAGKLFRNEDGEPWKRFAIANRFDRLHLALGIEALKEQGISVPPLPRFNRRAYADAAQLAAARKEHQRQLRERRKQIAKLARRHGKRFALVDTRHGFCQRLLEGGANHLAVAELMGHSTGRMVAETDSHMNRHG